jgi:sporulation protein YlmC with PRC-barrel domain
VDTKTACVVAFVIFNRFFLFGIFKNNEDFIIPWEKIQMIGEDVILVGGKIPKPQKNPRKRLFFWKN